MSWETKAVKRAGSMAALGVVARTASQAMSLVILLLAGRFLTIELFGIFALAVILVNLSQAIMFAGVYHFILKEPDIEETIPTAFTLHSALSLGFAVLILLASGLLGLLAPDQTLLVPLLASTAGLPVISLIGCWQEAIALRAHKVRFYYMTLLLSEFLGFVVGVSMLVSGFGVWSLIASRYVAFAVMAICMWLASGPLPKPGWNPAHARRIFSYSSGLYGQSGLGFLTVYWSDIIIGVFLSERAVGLYRMGARMATAAFDIFAQTTRVLSWQVTGKLSREGRLKEPVWISMYAVVMTTTMAALGSMMVLGEDLIQVVLGDEWLPMVPILQIVCLARIISSFDLIANAQLGAAGHTAFLFRLKLIEAVILIVAVSAAVRFGPVAVAIGLLPSVIIVNGVALHRTMKYTGTRWAEWLSGIWPGVVISLSTIAGAEVMTLILSGESAFMKLLCGTSFGLGVMLFMGLIVFRPWTLKHVGVMAAGLMPARNTADSDQAADPKATPEPTPLPQGK